MTNISHNTPIKTTPISRPLKTNMFSRLSKVTSSPVGVSTLSSQFTPCFKGLRVANHNELSPMSSYISSIKHSNLKAAKQSLRLGSFLSSQNFSYGQGAISFSHESLRFDVIRDIKNNAAEFLSCFSAAKTIPENVLRGSSCNQESLNSGLNS
jgi:hypothetical protein